MSRCGPTARTASGFTVLELMIVVSLLGLFFAAVQETVLVGLRAVNAADDRETIRQQAAAALDRFTREAALAADVDRAEDDRFQFDVPSVSNVDYDYDSNTGALTRDDGDTSQITILSNITSFDLNYVDSSGTTLTTPVAEGSEDTIRVVQVTVTVTRDTESLSLASAAYLRNL